MNAYVRVNEDVVRIVKDNDFVAVHTVSIVEIIHNVVLLIVEHGYVFVQGKQTVGEEVKRAGNDLEIVVKAELEIVACDNVLTYFMSNFTAKRL